MLRIEEGSFDMGSPGGEIGRANDEDLHTVELSRAYCLGTYEVRRSDWSAWMHYQAGYFDDCGDDCPIESVSWHEAAAFANAISDAEPVERCYDCEGSGWNIRCEAAMDPYTCRGYRLPTEAEWERAARAGDDSAFPEDGELRDGDHESCRDDIELTNGTALSDFAWWCGLDDSGTHPAGHLAPNPWGLHDMRGNVYEWCHDGYDDYGAVKIDPLGPDTASRRVLRGGSFAVNGGSLRSAKRHSADPDSGMYIYGFRLARSVD
jgi:formylglycine-generating enzyme required for sulfatase activity